MAVISGVNEIDIDYAQPLASLLKTATSAAHESAEHSQGAGWLTRGELDREEYVRFLMMLYHVYSTLEAALEKHSAHPALAPTYNPTLLARAPSLASDISFLLDVPESSWQSHPIHESLKSVPPPPLAEYVSRIRFLADDAADPSPLLAHAYVRYLGDLSGGQFIRRRIAKVYEMERDDGRGTMFYDFKQLGGSKSGNIGDMRKIKEWFREGMNQGGGDDEARKKAITEEAVKVFELNEGLFTTLRPPSSATTEDATAERPPLGNPSPPTTPIRESPEPSAVKQPTEKLYSLSSILTFVLAVAAAHFFLVVGGFTGERGFSKFQSVQQRIEDFVNSLKA